MTKYTVGIDTGGTYTDAIILDADAGKVLASAKALTTRGDLSLGVTAALSAVLIEVGAAFPREEIKHVSLSTTLATNALVEGHGASVTVFLVGFDDGMVERSGIVQSVSETRIERISGGHTYDGAEMCALDEQAVLEALEGEAGRAAGFAVAGMYSVRNPEHERRIQSLVREHTGRPVTVSCDLSDTLHGPRRALTAVCNARIISLIVDLQESVEQAMRDHGIEARLMMVKGDGSLAPAALVTVKPVETILSGPAASVIGAGFLTGIDDYVVADMGGTTSDVARVRDGWPQLCEDGADIGGYRTLVRAVDMQTLGLGGDSLVVIGGDGSVDLDRQRVVSLSLLSQRYPAVLSDFRAALGETSGWLEAIRYLLVPDGMSEASLPEDLVMADRAFLLRLIAVAPARYHDFVEGAVDRVRLSRLINRGLVQISGLTPSDAAHVLGLQSQWSSDGARLGCELVRRGATRLTGGDFKAPLEDFAQLIHGAVVARAARVLLNRLSGGSVLDGGSLIDAVVEGRPVVGDLHVSFIPQIPVIAVGGPAQVFFPAVGARLQAETVIPEFGDVANAVGAAAGLYRARVVVEVTRGGKKGYVVHTAEGPEPWENGPDALERALECADTMARSRLQEMGGVNDRVEVSTERIDIPDMDAAYSLISATVTAEASARLD